MNKSNDLSDLKTSNPLGYVKIPKLIVKYALPGVIAMVVNSIYNIVDQIFIGRGVGYLGNTATTISFPFTTLAMAISLMIAHGNGTYMNIKLGEKNSDEASEAFGSAFVMSLIAGFCLCIGGLIFLDKLLVLFGATEASLPYAREYTKYIMLGLPLVTVSQCMNNATRADGSPRYSMLTLCSGAVLNTVLDPIFIFVFKWGVAGAAIATVIGQAVSCIVALTYMKRFKTIQIKKENFKLRMKYCTKICVLGISNFITQFSSLITQVAMTNMLRIYGEKSVYGAEIPIAAVGITMKINMILFAVLLGIGNGQQPIIGYNYGAREFARVKKTYYVSAVISTAAGFIGWASFQLFPIKIISLFGQENALYTDFAVRSLTTFLGMIFLAGFMVTTTTFFQSMGKAGTASLLSLCRSILVYMPLLIMLPRYFGIDGILYAMPITDIIMFIMSGIFSIREVKKLNKYIALTALE